MLAGVSGSLVSGYFAETALGTAFAGLLGEDTREAARRRVIRQARQWKGLGPVSTARTVYDVLAVPFVQTLGFEPAVLAGGGDAGLLLSRLGPAGSGLGPESPLLVTTAWGQTLDAAWRAAAPAAIASAVEWCLCTNGRAVRLVDARRALARAFLEFELDVSLEDDASFRVLWGLLRRESFLAPCLVDRVVRASARHTVGVCLSLRRGVLEAIRELLGAFGPPPRCASGEAGGVVQSAYEQALTVVYRMLFLLFAESRGLVPLWHPLYRDSYSIESLCDLAERPGRSRGLWQTLQAMARLAHAGCQAGTLRVTPFNGRLFSPSATPLGEHRHIGEDAVRRMVLALSTAPGRAGGRARIVYRDLGVEQLGAVYESVLDFRPEYSPGGTPALVREGGARKATGTFYTPRSITTHLVHRTLAPLTEGADPEAILSLRVVDPAMGSGAFLVAACRFLAAAYETALVERRGIHPGDITEDDRRLFRRQIVQRCLYGVDRNPMAVQLARLSLWLCTLAPDRPLTFLDHRLVVGDSLVGASPDDLKRPPPTSSGGRLPKREPTNAVLPLFGEEGPGPALRSVIPRRWMVASTPDDSVEAVREKERSLAALAGPSSPLAPWRALADVWCAAAFADRRWMGPGLFFAVADYLLRGTRSLPDRVITQSLSDAREAARIRRFCHWPLEFPEVFFGEDGTPRPDAGFDAVIGNPPWDMVRGDNGGGGARDAARREASLLHRFARYSGHYTCAGDGHVNLFQLFVERAFRLARRGGRIGLVVPWGLASDRGSAGLRRLLLDRCRTDALVGFENTRRIFPIHRSVRFLLFTATTGGHTDRLPVRMGLRDTGPLESGADLDPVCLPRALLERLSPGDLSIPDLRAPSDLALLEKAISLAPALGSPEGWGAAFGRELNATDDAPVFVQDGEGLPVLEGKHVEPFAVAVPGGGRRLPLGAAAAWRRRVAWDARRLAYRDVASATNRLTLIAALVPAGTITVHTLSCLKSTLAPADQAFLCGVLNSFVANYLVRLRVTTHVTAGIVSRLPVPKPHADSPLRTAISTLSLRLSESPSPESSPDYARLQAAVARLYALTTDEFEHVLKSFPLVEEERREEAMGEFLKLGNWETGKLGN